MMWGRVVIAAPNQPTGMNDDLPLIFISYLKAFPGSLKTHQQVWVCFF